MESGNKSSEFKKILLFRNDKIGDAVMALPVFAKLKAMYPGAEVWAIVRKNTLPVYEHNGVSDGFIVSDELSFDDLAREARNLQPDLYLALYHNQVAESVGLSLENCLTVGHSHPPRFLNYHRRVLQVRRYSRSSETLHMLNVLKSMDPDRYRAVSPARSFYRYGDAVSPLTGDYLLFHPFTGGTSGAAHAGTAATILRTVVEATAMRAVISTLPEQEAEAEEIVSMSGSGAEVIVPSDINQLAAIIDRSRLFVGSSSAPLHIANSLHKPAVGYFTKYRNTHIRFGAFDNERFASVVLPAANPRAAEAERVPVVGEKSLKRLRKALEKCLHGG
jgi:heptosyltransferase-3